MATQRVWYTAIMYLIVLFRFDIKFVECDDSFTMCFKVCGDNHQHTNCMLRLSKYGKLIEVQEGGFLTFEFSDVKKFGEAQKKTENKYSSCYNAKVSEGHC
ncbi:unnamed protein product [Albugo candida]|uniref:Uncharacterized protein n=1 Tax=Albugo candida TaxID=65357 RepID=A0A024FXB0_9STRA|nr:unnamed protein product [Albugo candida]|eukprot:CCI11818.1 unnamed protein product [Albugo candida]